MHPPSDRPSLAEKDGSNAIDLIVDKGRGAGEFCRTLLDNLRADVAAPTLGLIRRGPPGQTPPTFVGHDPSCSDFAGESKFLENV